MPLCSVHWYRYVPGAVGMIAWNVPADWSAESSIAAEGNVTLCVAPPEAHVHVTVAPGETWMAEGTNALPVTVTAVVRVGPPPPP
jgi:hypothetical protein